MTWTYTDPNSDLSHETPRELSDTLSTETFKEGTTRTDGESTQTWKNGAWEDVE